MAATDGKQAQLRSVPLFAELNKADLQAVDRVSDIVDLPAGRVVMRQGDVGNEMFVMVSGAATVVRNGRPPKVVGPGTILGEMAIVSEGPRTATVTLTEPSTLIVIGHRDFHGLVDTSPAIMRCVFNSLAARIRTLEEEACH